MPSSPEFGDIPREIRIGEIPHQAESEQSCGTDSNVRVTRKVSVYLKSKKYDSKQQSASIVVCMVGKNRIDNMCTIVRNDHFLKEAPQNLPQAVDRFLIFKVSFGIKLRQKIFSSFDRACYQLGKKTDKSKECNDVLCRCNFISINVYRIA